MPERSGENRPTGLNWRDPSTWHLRTRLVLVAMALLVAICGAIGIASYASMDFFLTTPILRDWLMTGYTLERDTPVFSVWRKQP